MAAINVVLNGTFTSDAGSQVGTFIGTMAYSDLSVGGGPVIPDKPSRPPPVDPGYGYPERPVDPGYGIPGPPYDPPTGSPPEGPVGADGFIKSPPEGGGWGYHPTYGWMLDPGPEGAGPKQ